MTTRDLTVEPGAAASAPGWVTLFTPLAKLLLRAGIPLGFNGLLTIRGRKTGLPRTKPVAIIEVDGRRWIWAPWGEVHWVRNLRAAGHATITQRGRSEEVRATELSADERVGFFRHDLGGLARSIPSVSGSFAPWMVWTSTIPWPQPRAGPSSSFTPPEGWRHDARLRWSGPLRGDARLTSVGGGRPGHRASMTRSAVSAFTSEDSSAAR